MNNENSIMRTMLASVECKYFIFFAFCVSGGFGYVRLALHI